MDQTLTDIIQNLALKGTEIKIPKSDYDRNMKFPKPKKVTPLKKCFQIYNPIPKKNNFQLFKRFASPTKKDKYKNSSAITRIISPESSNLSFISPKNEKEDNIFLNINSSLYLNFENNNVKPSKHKFKKINFEKIYNYKQNQNKILLPHKTSLNTYKPPGCNCKNSKCLKLYCKCFQSGKGCVDCNCVGCENIENSQKRNDAIKDQNILNPNKMKNKKIEAHKIFSVKENTVKYRLTLSSGCNCKNSKCQKKYCECFQYGLNCSPKCKCQNCLNDKIKNVIYDDDPMMKLQKRNFTNIKEELRKKLLMIKRVKFNIN